MSGYRRIRFETNEGKIFDSAEARPYLNRPLRSAPGINARGYDGLIPRPDGGHVLVDIRGRYDTDYGNSLLSLQFKWK